MSSQSQALARRRLEFVDEVQSRFYEVWIDETRLNRRYGVIGRPGRVLETNFGDSEAALLALERCVTDKLLDGYEEVTVPIPEKIEARSLARLYREQKRADVKKAIRIFAGTKRAFCTPKYVKQDLNSRADRICDQVIGGVPFLSELYPWPVTQSGASMHFIAQLNLENAGDLLNEDLGSGLLQVWSQDEWWDKFYTRKIEVKDLDAPLSNGVPEDIDSMNQSGMINAADLGNRGRPLIKWRVSGPMHYPNPWVRVCGQGELVEAIDIFNVDSYLSELSDQDDWKRSLALPTFFGRRGKGVPNVYLGGYTFAEGNGWDIHDPSRRSLLNIWADSGILWHVCISVDKEGRFFVHCAGTR